MYGDEEATISVDDLVSDMFEGCGRALGTTVAGSSMICAHVLAVVKSFSHVLVFMGI